MVVADLVQLTKVLADSIHEHIEASKVLKAECGDLDTVVAQVTALVAELGKNAGSEDEASLSSMRVGLEKTRLLLDDVRAFTAEMALRESGATAKLCSCAGRGAKTSLADLQRVRLFETKLRKQVDLLTSLVTVTTQTAAHTAALKESVVKLITNPEACKFWTRSFGETTREISWTLFRDALLAEYNRSAAGTTTATSAAKLDDVLKLGLCSSGDSVSVFQFNAVFRHGTVGDALTGLLASFEEARKVWRISVRDRETKQEVDVDAGFVLIPEKAHLSTIRSEIIASAQEDEELPPEVSFLAEGNGKFTFYLEEGKARVKKSQEPKVSLVDADPGLCVVADTEVSADKPVVDVAKKSASAKYKIQISPVVDENEADDDGVAMPDQSRLALRALESQARARTSDQLSLESVLQDPLLLSGMRAVLQKMGLSEDSVDFLQRYQKLQQNAADANSTEQIRDDFLKTCNEKMLLEFEIDAKTGDSKGPAVDIDKVAAGIREKLGDVPLQALRDALQRAPPRVRMGRGKRVVVIGGGFGGAHFCCLMRHIAPEAHLTLIDEKTYFEYTPIIFRSMVKGGEHWDTSHLPHKEYLGEKNALVVGRALEVNENHVVVGAQRQIVPFDFCVNFSGTTYHSDIKTETTSTDARRNRMEKEKENITESARVLVVGGGVCGCELAADVRYVFPEKEVILVHGHAALMQRLPGAHDKTLPVLEKMGVSVHLSDRILPYTGGDYFETESGDLQISVAGTRVYWCTGYRANCAHFKRSVRPNLKAAANEAGYLKADDFLRVGGTRNVFAGGDSLEARFFCEGERMAHYAELHSGTIALNVSRLVADPDLPDDQLARRAPSSGGDPAWERPSLPHICSSMAASASNVASRRSQGGSDLSRKIT
eukprot:g8199.t1